jgi:trehalose 6-phosphate phosphatase
MIDILTKPGLAKLADFAYSNVLLGFDYDGTLAPTASQPEDARMRAAARRLLARVAEKYPCVVISGRARGDLVRRLSRLPLWHIIGNHGLEPWSETKSAAAQVREWVRRLRAGLEGCAGVVVEDKRYSATIHYRHARDQIRARGAIAAHVRALAGARALRGDMAVNLIPRDGPDKGVALQRARRVLACDAVIYVGNDGSDEDAFTSGAAGRLLAVRIGRSKTSGAPYYLRSQSAIDRLLQALLTFRARRAHDSIAFAGSGVAGTSRT